MSKCPECENRGVGGGHLRGCIYHDDPNLRRVGWNLDPVFDHPDNPKADR
jgi:hypothetical protein